LTIGTTDIFLLVIIVSTLVVGFFWGALRSLLLFAVWILAFLFASYLKKDLGAYLAREWGNFSASFNDMAAFALIYLGALLVAPAVIFISTRGNQRITRYQVLDDFIGAFFALAVALLSIAGTMIVLAAFYGPGPLVIDTAGGPQWTANLYQSLLSSTIGGAINDTLVPLIGFVLGPVLPTSVREVFG
jgi:uncharacterized membrane protein required for colicin V production